MFECRGEDSEHYQAPYVVAPNCCLAEQSHRKLTDPRHGRELSDFPNAMSVIQETSMPDNIQTSGPHPFSSSSDKTVAFLHSLLDTTARVAHSVTLHSTTAVNDSRTVSPLLEQTTGEYLLRLVHPLYLIPSFQVSLM